MYIAYWRYKPARSRPLAEDIGAYGGVWALSKGLQRKYGEDRVFDTPLSECAIMGACTMARGSSRIHPQRS